MQAILPLADTGLAFTISGNGITNNSAITQNLVVSGKNNFTSANLNFINSATAGALTAIGVSGPTSNGQTATLTFTGNATAGSSSITLAGGSLSGYNGGTAYFYDTTNLDNANVTLGGGTASGAMRRLSLFRAKQHQ